MRKLTIGTEKYTKVYATDEKGAGGANHNYIVESTAFETIDDEKRRLATIHFQEGAIKESGINGVMNEDLLAMVIDRLQGFQSDKFACRENAIALTKLEEALMWLRKRTDDRERRNVEGTHNI